MSDPEIITLSSDEDTKPLVRMQFSKRKRGKGDVNPTASKKIALQFQASCSSKTQNVQNRHQFQLKSSAMSKNETRTVALPVYKHQNVTQNGNIHNQRFSSKLPPSSSLYKYQNTTQNGNIRNQHFSSKLSSSSSLQKYKDGKSSYVSVKQFGNTKSVCHLQNQCKSNTVSNSFHTLRTSTPKNSVMNTKNSRTSDNVNFIQKSNEKQSENSSNKMNIPLSVLSALREKGISITNVDDKPKSNVAVCNKQSESQKYLNKLKSSLRKSNTNINVIPKANTASSFSTLSKANGISHGYVHGLKNAVKGSSYNLNKYQNEKKVLPSTQSMPNKYAKDIPYKFSSEIKVIEKPATVTKSVTVTNVKKFVHNSAQRDLLCFQKPPSASSRLTKKDSTSGSCIQIPSRPFPITPISKPKSNFDKSIFPPEINIIKVDNSKQNKKAATPCFTSVPTSNSAASIRTVNSSLKYALNTNNKKTSPAVVQKPSLQSNIKKYKPRVTKNVDLLNGRDTLLTLLSLCDDNEEKSPSCVIPATYTSNPNLSIVPVTSESSVCHSEIESISPLIKSMKLKDVASKTHNWRRLIVSLERLDIHKICIKEKISVPKTVTGAFDLYETDNKYANGQKLEKCSDYHSVKSDDDHLSPNISEDKTECSVALKNSNTCISLPKTVTGAFDLPKTADMYSNGQELEEFYEKISADSPSVISVDDHLSTSISGDKPESSGVLKNSIVTCISVPKTLPGADLSETDDKHLNEQELEEFCDKISADCHSVTSEDDHLSTNISGDKPESSAVLMNSVDTSISVPKTVPGADLSENDDKHLNEQELEEFCEKISADCHSVISEDEHLSTSISGDKPESSVVLMNSVDTSISVPKTVTIAFDLPETDDKHSNEHELEVFCGKISSNCHSVISDDHLSRSVSGDKTESSVVSKNSNICISFPETVTGAFDLSETDDKHLNEHELEEFCEKIPADCHSVISEDDYLSTSISGDKSESSVVLMNSIDTRISVPKTVPGTDLSETDDKHLNEQELEEFCEKISADCHSVTSEDEHLSTSISCDKPESSVVLMNSVDTSISVPKTVTVAFDLPETDDKHSNEHELKEFCEKIPADCHSVISEDDYLSTSISGDKPESSVVLMNSVDTCISVPKTVPGADLCESDDKHLNEQKLEEFCEKISADYHSVKSDDNDLSTGISGDRTETSVVLMNSRCADFPDDVGEENSKSFENLKISRESVCTISNILKINTVTETGDSSYIASLDSVMTLKKDNNTFDTVDSLHATDPSHCTKIEILTENSSKNSGNLLANPNSNDISKAKCILQSDIDNYFVPNYDVSNSNEVKNLLNSIILKICNMQFKEVQNTCMEVLNIIISTIENLSDSLLTETEIITNIQRACQSVKHAPTEKLCNLLSDNACEDIIQKGSTAVHTAVNNNHCIEIYKEGKSLTFDMPPNIEEKLSDSLAVPNQLLEETNISLPIDEDINMCDRTDANTNSDIINKSILLKESSKEIFNKTNFNLTAEKNKFKENETICDESDLKIKIDNTESLAFNYDVTEQKVDRSEISESMNSDNEMDFTISSEIAVDEYNQMKFSKDDACFQDDNALISVSPLRENGALSCIIVQVESRQDLFTEEERHLEDDSEFKQNLCVIEQDNMDFNDEEPEPCMTLFSFTEDTSTSDKCAFTDDEGKNTLNQADSTQVTSPKLSLKRNRSIESPDGKLLADNSEYFANNGLKRIKLNESVLSIGQETFPSSDNNPVSSDNNPVSSDNNPVSSDNNPVSSDNNPVSSDNNPVSSDNNPVSSDNNPVPLYETLEETNHRKFMELLEYSKTLMDVDSSEEEKDKITKIMIKKLGETQPWYAGSEKFSAQIECTTNKLKRVVENSGENVFSILQEMRKEFKKYKSRSRFGINRENSQDTNLACCSSSVSSDFVEGNNSAITRETAISENMKISFKINTDEINDSSEASSHTLLYRHSVKKPDICKPKTAENSVFVNNTVDINDSSEASSHPLLYRHLVKKPDICKPKTAENSVFVNNTVDKGSPALEPVLSSTIESSNSKNAFSDNQLNSVATSSTSEHNSSISNSSMQLVTKSNISDKDKTNSSDLSSLKLQSLNSHEPSTVADGITDMHLRPSTSKDNTYSSKDVTYSSKDVTYSSKNGTKTSSLDTNCSNKHSEGKVNSNLSAFLPVDKTNHAISVLKKEKAVKANPRSTGDRSAVRIEKLEKMLQKLDKKIKKLQERELSLDDLDDEESAYMLEEKFKNRFMKVWSVLCKVKKQSSRTGRVVDKKFKYEGSRYKPINVAVEKMINKRKAHEKFPDYVEVLTLIKQVNEFEDIGLNEKLVENEAESVFRDIGKELQSRRCRDFEDLLGCHLTDNFDPVNDPAEHDETLRKILNENKQSFEQSINQVIDSYAEKQLVTPEDEDNQDNSSEEEDDQEEREKDLPLTDPGSPNSNTLDSCKNDVIEIVNESDKSTDPNEEMMKRKDVKTESNAAEVNPINVQSSGKIFLESIVIEDSNSSDDLPSIQDVMNTR